MTTGPSDPGSGGPRTRTFGYDGGRLVSVHLPSGPPRAVVYAADGRTVARWGRSSAGADVVIVGVHGHPDEAVRLREYSPGFDPDRFAAHERFVVEDVRSWIRSEFGLSWPVGRTAVFGASAGGEFALALGLRHPELFGVVLAGSPGAGYRPPDALPTPLPRTYLVAGTGEPFFLDNATRWADALRGADADVVLSERDGEHGPDLWRAEFPRMLAWAFDQPA